jgi:hypothetical protein
MSVAPVAQDDIGRCTLAQRLEPSLDLVALVGEETVLERRQIDDSSGRICQKLPGRRVRLVGARADGAEHRSVRIQTDASVDPAQSSRPLQSRCRPNEHRCKALKGARRVVQAQGTSSNLPLRIVQDRPGGHIKRQGIVPLSTRSSRTCLSFSVSMVARSLRV